MEQNGIYPLAIGSEIWPGLHKLSEECGELIQLIGKLGAFPNGDHPKDIHLVEHMEQEMADVQAAIAYVLWANEDRLHESTFMKRFQRKFKKFVRWHKTEREMRSAL